jgi:hypothetical protein
VLLALILSVLLPVLLLLLLREGHEDNKDSVRVPIQQMDTFGK